MENNEKLKRRLSVCPFCGAEHNAEQATPEPGLKLYCQCGAVASVDQDSKGLFVKWQEAGTARETLNKMLEQATPEETERLLLYMRGLAAGRA